MRRLLLLVCGAALGSGCGVILDLDPPDGMDARVGSADAGPLVECRRDVDCDNGRVCDGIEVCSAGHCESGPPVECDDGIACTRDRCREASGGCVVEPVDSRCPGGTDCGEGYCDVELGCQVRSDHSACDDGVDCTIDVCVDGLCSNPPDHRRCGDRSYCEVDPRVEGAPGCRAYPSCVMDDGCPLLPCRRRRCVESECMYDVDDSALMGCGVEDPCLPTACVDGECVTGERVRCAVASGASCMAEQCVRDGSGRVRCELAPRTGACRTRDCYRGTCTPAGTCDEEPSCGTPLDPCRTSLCDEGTCTTPSSVSCGAFASCVVDSAGDASCACDTNYSPCSPGSVDCCLDLPDAGLPPELDAGGFDAGGFDAGVLLPDASVILPEDGSVAFPEDGSVAFDADVVTPRCPGGCRPGEVCCRGSRGDYCTRTCPAAMM